MQCAKSERGMSGLWERKNTLLPLPPGGVLSREDTTRWAMWTGERAITRSRLLVLALDLEALFFDLLAELEDTLNQRFRTGWAAGDVDIDRDDAVYALH